MTLYAAIVKSYDKTRRRVRVDMGNMTSGAEHFPEAEIMYPVGEAHYDTEILIREGDKVYCQFVFDGDKRYPVVVGYRNPITGNLADIRRIRQKNIELIADNITLIAKNIKADCTELTSTGVNQFENKTNLNGGAGTKSGSAPILEGGAKIKNGPVTHDGIDIGKTHKHTTIGIGSETSSVNG